MCQRRAPGGPNWTPGGVLAGAGTTCNHWCLVEAAVLLSPASDGAKKWGCRSRWPIRFYCRCRSHPAQDPGAAPDKVGIWWSLYMSGVDACGHWRAPFHVLYGARSSHAGKARPTLRMRRKSPCPELIGSVLPADIKRARRRLTCLQSWQWPACPYACQLAPDGSSLVTEIWCPDIKLAWAVWSMPNRRGP